MSSVDFGASWFTLILYWWALFTNVDLVDLGILVLAVNVESV